MVDDGGAQEHEVRVVCIRRWWGEAVGLLLFLERGEDVMTQSRESVCHDPFEEGCPVKIFGRGEPVVVGPGKIPECVCDE